MKAQLAPEGFQDPDPNDVLVETAGCVSLRSPPLQMIPLNATKKWKLRILDTRNASAQADTLDREGRIRAPPKSGTPRNPGGCGSYVRRRMVAMTLRSLFLRAPCIVVGWRVDHGVYEFLL